MRILYFAPHTLLPLTTGGRLRDYHLARELARHAQVTFLQMDREKPRFEEEPSPEAAVFEGMPTLLRGPAYTPLKVLRGLIGPSSLPVLNYSSQSMFRALKDLLKGKHFDTIQIENVHLLPFVPAIRAAAPGSVLVADWHNIESELMRRYAVQARNPARKLVALRTAQLLAKEESRFLRQVDAHTVPSERERRMLIGVHPAASVHVVPNGVAVQSYMANERGLTSGKRLMFTGSMDYHANVDAVAWFVRDVWPAILVRHPDAEFTVVGRDPPEPIRKLADVRVHVTGSVPDVRPYFRNADIAVVPLRAGSGTRLKILEAMAAGVPVVSTTLGAEGINAEAGKDFLRADTVAQIVEAVDQLLTSPPLRSGVSTAARQLVERSYDWGQIGWDLFELHSRLATDRGKYQEHDAHA